MRKKIIEAIVIEKCVLLINKLKFPPKSAIELKYCHLSFINLVTNIYLNRFKVNPILLNFNEFNYNYH